MRSSGSIQALARASGPHFRPGVPLDVIFSLKRRPLLYASVESLVGNLVLIDLDGPPLYLDVRLLMNPQRRLAKPVCDFTDFLRETFAAAD